MFGILKKYDVHLCSEVHGRITHNGEPVVGATVKRQLEYSREEEERVDSTETDSDGKFSLPLVEIRSTSPGSMFGVDRTFQQIHVTHGDVTYLLWCITLPWIEELAEYKEKLACINADLKDPEVRFSFKNKSLSGSKYGGSGICRWDKDFQIREYDDDDGGFFD